MLAICLLLAQAKPLYPYLAAEINDMAKVDQDVRDKFIDELKNGGKPTMDTIKRMNEVDHKDTERMKQIVQGFGWPTPAMVGKDASDNAWMLVQHADADHPFQKKCLALLEPLARQGVIPGNNYTYLFDRVQVGDGKLQRFGTQGKEIDGADMIAIDPVEDPIHVDALRKQYGMPPLEEYAKKLAEMYHLKLAPDWRERLKAPKKPRKA